MISRTRLSIHEPAALKAGMLNTPVPLFDNMQLGGAAMTFERNAEIYGEGETADYVYKVLSGSVRTYKVLSDGRRQVTAFFLPGDVFGINPRRHSPPRRSTKRHPAGSTQQPFQLAEATRSPVICGDHAAELRRSQDHACY
jgi:hypothetical protein